MVDRHTIIPAVYLVLRKDNQVLMLCRANTGYYDGAYSLISGHLDGGESARAALVREAKEEAGIEVLIDDLVFRHAVNRPSKEGGTERVDFFFECGSWKGGIVNAEPHKCDDLSWFSIDNLPGKMVPEVEHVLAEVRKGSYYSELNW